MDLHDEYVPNHAQLIERTELAKGAIFTVVKDTIALKEGASFQRDYMIHDDAVAILPVREFEGREQFLLIRQYRHAVGHMLWEIPAGLCDKAGEEPIECARRELREETDCVAQTFTELVGFYTSPGCSTEHLKVFCASGVEQAPENERTFIREEEESEIITRWWDGHTVLQAVLDGSLSSPTLVNAVLAYYAQKTL